MIALVVLADGAHVLLFRTTEALSAWAPHRPVPQQAAAGAALPYGTYLRWRGVLPAEPPRRPEPARPSASAAGRSGDWKFGFVGSSGADGEVHLPPQPSDATAVPMADATGTIATFTVDRLAYSPSPPVVFAVVDFDGGGRLPVELTDVDIGAGPHRRPRRAHLPPAVHRRRHPQLLLEGADRLMGSHGIKDRVAIVGMGCTRFAEHWDKGLDDLLVDATDEAFTSAGVTKDDVDAYWLGTAQGGMSGMLLAKPLQLDAKPVTRVENMCATGSEALRQAAYAVASGAYDLAMAVGVEKVKDSGYQGLNAFPVPSDGTQRTLTAAAMFSMVAPAYARALRRADGRAQGGARPHRVEEPPQRRPQPARPVPS